MKLLRDFQRYDTFIDMATNRECSAELDAPTIGWCYNLGGYYSKFFVDTDKLYLSSSDIEVEIGADAVAQIEWMRKIDENFVEKRFVLKQGECEVLDFQYIVSSAHSIAEHEDWGLLLYNIVNNKDRVKQILTFYGGK